MRMPGSTIKSRQTQPVQTIAIAGGKGGVGKSVVAANLAATLGSDAHDVLLVDGDLEMGSIDQLLSLHPKHTLSDVMSGHSELSDIVLQGPKGVSVVPSGSGVYEMAQLSQVEHASLIGLFSDLCTEAEVMIIDVATGLSESMLSFCRAVREVIIVVVDEPTAVRDAYATIRVLHEKCRTRRFRVVSNKTQSSCHGLDIYSALVDKTDQTMDVLLDYCGSIPFDPQLKLAVCQQQSVIEAYPCSPSALAFRKLGARVSRWPQPQTPCGHIEFFVERLIQTAEGTR